MGGATERQRGRSEPKGWERPVMVSRVAFSGRLAITFRRQGFLPSRIFIQQVVRRARLSTLGWHPRDFRRLFCRAAHVRRTDPWGTVLLALVGGSPIAYRPATAAGGCVVLLGFV